MRASCFLFTCVLSFWLQAGRAQISPITVRQLTEMVRSESSPLPVLIALFNPKCASAPETIRSINQAAQDHGANSVVVVSVIQDTAYLAAYTAISGYTGTLYYLEPASYGTGREKSERFLQEAAQAWRVPRTEFSYLVLDSHRHPAYAGDDLSTAVEMLKQEQPNRPQSRRTKRL